MKSSFLLAGLAALASAAPSAPTKKIQAMRLDGKLVTVESKNPGTYI